MLASSLVFFLKPILTVKFWCLLKFLLLLMIVHLIIDKPDPAFLIVCKFFLFTFPRPIVTVPHDVDVANDEQRLDKSKQLEELLHRMTKLL